MGRHAINAVARPGEVRFVVGDEDMLFFPVPVTHPSTYEACRQHPFVDEQGNHKPVSVIPYRVGSFQSDYDGGELLHPDLGELALAELSSILATNALAGVAA